MARSINGNYYTNPAFSQQSEFYNYQNKKLHKSQISLRQSPVGAQTPHKILDNSMCDDTNLNDTYEEQDFYEEVLVDDSGVIKGKKIVIVSQNQNEGRSYIQSQQNLSREVEVTYTASEERIAKKQRYEYIPMKENTSPTRQNRVKELEDTDLNSSRYEVIDVEEEGSTTKNRYALVPLEDLNKQTIHRISRTPSQRISTTNLHRYEYIDDPIEDSINSDYRARNTSRYHLNQHNSPPRNPGNLSYQNTSRYDYIHGQTPERTSQRSMNMTPTQKLHEILSTPKKLPMRQDVSQKVLSPQSHRRTQSIQRTPVVDPFVTPKKPSPKKQTPSRNSKAQQKLNYSIGSRQMTPNTKEKRHTAMVAPICSSPVQSVYSETTYSNKSESWMNLSVKKPPIQATLAVAALMMFVCGGLSSGMCFYMMSLIGKVYYLEFGIVSGFACLTLGVLGFRTRYCHWLPNRNYISGYIVLSVFSLLTCAALLILLFMQPRPGTPLADMTSGAVSGISVLSLCLAATGVVSSYCCSYPPPDNRVQHCAQGFTV
ncbi:hypothetical protein WA026_017571 [Henosepilachna vigintioctopunctata]|uniref:Sanpodo n=1 Tax=Henosepilachna vigintioctopunctata TaxID=420089 RepID=A0AAW1UZN7_9CUCU